MPDRPISVRWKKAARTTTPDPGGVALHLLPAHALWWPAGQALPAASGRTLHAIGDRFKNLPDIIGNIMIRVLLDTNVLVAGLTSSRGASFVLLQAVAAGKLQVAASPALWLEYESVLKRDSIRALHGFSVQQIDQILSALAVWVHPVSLHYIWRPQLRDPGDEMVLEAAVNGQVSALVTHNVRDFSAAAPKFSLQVLTPAQLILTMEKKA